jgi:hypothetical protein
MNRQLIDLLLASDPQGIDQLRRAGQAAPDQAALLAFAFFRESTANGRHIWGGFRNQVLQTLMDLIGSSSAEDQLLSEWQSFPEEARLDFVYDVISGDPWVVSTPLAERLFFHSASSTQCKGNILDSLLQSRDRRNLDESYFFGLLDKLAADARPANRDDVELLCIEIFDLFQAHLERAR